VTIPKGDTRSLATLTARRWFGGVYVVTGIRMH
jgi:hypothetical protein